MSTTSFLIDGTPMPVADRSTGSNARLRGKARWLYARAVEGELQMKELKRWLAEHEHEAQVAVAERTRDTLGRLATEVASFRSEADSLMSTITARMTGLGPIAA